MLLRYVWKSTKATGQFVGAVVLGTLGVSLLFFTVFRWRFESTFRDGIQSAATGQGDAMATLEEAKSARPDDPLPWLFLGQVYLEKGMRQIADQRLKPDTGPDGFVPAKRSLETARLDFDHAREKGATWPLGVPDSCSVGGCVTRLVLADLSPAERTQLLADATTTLATAKDQEDPDVTLARAGLAIASGDMPAAQKALADASPRLGDASRNAVGSYYWHKGLFALMGRDPAAVEFIRTSILFRQSPEAAKMFALAVRVAVADPGAAPKEPQLLMDRCAAITSIVGQHLKMGVSRWGLEKPQESQCWNAIGMGYVLGKDPKDAIEIAFTRAKNIQSKEVLYYMNSALATLSKADETPPPGTRNVENWQKGFYLEAARALYEDVGQVLAHEKGDEKNKYALDALLLSAGLYLRGGHIADAFAPIELAHIRFGLEDREYHRNRGALSDWQNRLDLAVIDYRKAIELKHKDSFKMEIRVDKFERGKR
jgi:tetratricopeptide (TPR) repeat protein